MTDDTNLISSKLRNKSLAEEISELRNRRDRDQFAPKFCFNPFCKVKGCKWVRIIGTIKDFRDNEIPYMLCEECYSSLISDLGRHMKQDLTPSAPLLGKPSSDLNRLITCHMDSESIKQISKTCYKHYCNNEGKRWTHIYPTLICDEDEAGVSWDIPYWVCDQCYARLEHSRNDHVALSYKIFIEESDRRGINLSTDFKNRWNQDLTSTNNEVIEENRIAIKVKDWVDLIESTKSFMRKN